MKQTLTPLEEKVFAALKQNVEDETGGEFGILGNIKYRKLGLTAQQFGALVTTLQTKRKVTVHEPVEINGGTKYAERLTQFTIR